MERRNKQKPPSPGIIAGLPNEVALCILARLPRSLQLRRRLICHAWKDAMEPSSMSSLRKALHISEEWIVVLSIPSYSYPVLFTILDPLQLRSHNISLPQELEKHCRQDPHLRFNVIGTIGSEVLIAGTPLRASEKGVELQGVYSFDAVRMKWGDSKYSALPISISIDLNYGFASATDMDSGHLYAAGGFTARSSVLGVQRLDTKTRMWEALPDSHVKRECAFAVMLQGLFHLVGGLRDDLASIEVVYSGEIWDPVNRQWVLVPELWPFEVFGRNFLKSRVAALKDRLYALRPVFKGNELMYYDSGWKTWVSMGRVPLDLSNSNEYLYDFGKVCLWGMGQELWVIDRSSMACVATKPTFSQPISWRTLPRTFMKCFPTHMCRMVAVLQV